MDEAVCAHSHSPVLFSELQYVNVLMIQKSDLLEKIKLLAFRKFIIFDTIMSCEAVFILFFSALFTACEGKCHRRMMR